jgi:hypothetical protein
MSRSADRIEPIEVAIRRLRAELGEAHWKGEDTAALWLRLQSLLREQACGQLWSVPF